MNSSTLSQSATTNQPLIDNATLPPAIIESLPVDTTFSTLASDFIFTFSPLAASEQLYSAKPKTASAGARHEWGTTTGLLPITSPQMAIGASPTTNIFQLLMSYYYQSQFLMPQLVKDDVFLAPAAIADNESVTTIDSNPPSEGNGWTPTPCLSPVSSPSDFLCNNEPLFDGIEDLQQHQQHSHQHNHSIQAHQQQKTPIIAGASDNYEINLSPSITPVIVTKPEPSDLNWFKLTKEEDGHTSSHLNMPTPSPTVSENESSLFGDDDDDDDDDDEPFSFDDLSSANNSELDGDEYGYFASPTGLMAPRSLKRKRSLGICSSSSVSSGEEEEDDSEYEGLQEGAATPVLHRFHRLRLFEPKSKKTLTGNHHSKQQQQQEQQQQQRKPKAKPVSKRRAKRHPNRRARTKTVAHSVSAAVAAAVIYEDLENEQDGVHRTIFERLTHAGIDWCRYCGTTEGVNWRPGPWGKRTLCNKHGCDYKGYGIASRLPRLDLSQYMNERLEERRRPVVQQQCVICKLADFSNDNMLIPCEGGCSRAYHQLCRIPAITTAAYKSQQWCCSTVCRENRKRNKVGPYEV